MFNLTTLLRSIFIFLAAFNCFVRLFPLETIITNRRLKTSSPSEFLRLNDCNTPSSASKASIVTRDKSDVHSHVLIPYNNNNCTAATKNNTKFILLICKRKCFTQRKQVQNWIKDYNAGQKNDDDKIGYRFIPRNVNYFTDFGLEIDVNTLYHIVYAIGENHYHYSGSLNDKNEFISFISSYKRIKIKEIADLDAIVRIFYDVEQCNNSYKTLLAIGSTISCSNRLRNDLLRNLYGSSYESLHIFTQHLSAESIVEIRSRIPDITFSCNEITILHNNNYLLINTDWTYQKIASYIDATSNTVCEIPEESWKKLGNELSDIEREYYIELHLAHELEIRPISIIVGTIGGIAVVAMAISIFWGLNGSAFTRK